MKPQTWPLFVVAPPGLEAPLAAELGALTEGAVKIEEGGVRLQGDMLDAAAICLWSRCAARTLLIVGDELPAPSLQQLHASVQALPWRTFLHPGQPLTVKATVKEAQFKRADAVEHHVLVAVEEALRKAPRQDGPRRWELPTVELRVRVRGKKVTVSIDVGGGLLHKRGYRQNLARAPLRENLAASVLLAAGWQPGVPLADPMCGSGTFTIEAACWAGERAPGFDHPMPILKAPNFPTAKWKEIVSEARSAAKAPVGSFYAADRDTGAVRATRENATRAGVVESLRIENRSLGEPINPPLDTKPGLVVINPPWGLRVAENVSLAPLYHKLGAALNKQFAGWRLAAICPDPALAGRLGRGLEEITRFETGGIQVGLWVGKLGRE